MFPPIIKDALVYANAVTLMSIGFTLVYMISRIPNFAQSTFAVLGVYSTFTIVKLFNMNPYIAMPIGLILGALLAIFIYLCVVNPMIKRGAGPIRLTISLMALQTIFISFVQIFADYVRTTYSIYSSGFMLRINDFQVGELPGILIVSSVAIFTIIIALHLLLTRTQFGIAMRATVENASLASVLGINIEQISIVSWAITGGLAGLSGSFLPLWFQSGTGSGGMIATSVFAGSVVGGLSSIYGAILGGYLISILEVWGSYILMRQFGTWVGSYRMLIPLTFLSVFLLFEPGGLVSLIKKYKTKYLKPKRLRRPEEGV